MSRANPEAPISAERPSAIDAAYDEALALTEQVRDYMSARTRDAVDARESGQGMVTVALTSQLTARLLEIVSWLAAQKAVQAGELSADEAVTSAAELSSWSDETEGRAEALAEVPGALKTLNERGRSLHERVLALAA